MNTSINNTTIDTATPVPADNFSTASTVEIEFLKTVIETENGFSNSGIIPALMHGDCYCNYPTNEGQLDAIESKLLADAEDLITNHWTVFCEVGLALNDIKEFELYREKYASFADYCKDKLKMHVYKD